MSIEYTDAGKLVVLTQQLTGKGIPIVITYSYITTKDRSENVYTFNLAVWVEDMHNQMINDLWSITCIVLCTKEGEKLVELINDYWSHTYANSSRS